MTIRKLYADVTGTTGLLSISVNQSHSAATTSANVNCEDTSLDIGDAIDIDLGYTDEHGIIFSGVVKNKIRKVSDDTYTLSCQDILIRAVDYFVVADSPDAPYTWDHIEAGDLIQNVLGLAGLSDFNFEETDFILGINTQAEVNLVSAYDYSKMIADIVAYSLWADPDGTIRFDNRKPYFVNHDDPATDQPGCEEDTPSGITLITTETNYVRSERDLRNRVMVYGGTETVAEAKSAKSYDPISGDMIQVLPNGFYKSIAVATPILDDPGMAQKAANYNLALYNRIGVQFNTIAEGNYLLAARGNVAVNNPILGISDNFYIYAVEHQWGKMGYTCNLELRR